MSQANRCTQQQPMRRALAIDKFPNLSQGLDALERMLVSKLFEIGTKAYRDDDGDRQWTSSIKDALEQLGVSEGCLPFPNSLKGDWNRGGEWLFDHVWCDVGGDGKELDWRETKALKLAVECEWAVGEYDLLSDFMKLTFVVAEHRLFVYTNTTIRTSDDTSAEPADVCYRRCPPGRGFRYLLIGFPEEWDGQFRVDAWTI